ncbi:Hpt domain-containing protein, partial [Pseudomonas cedrina]
SNQTIGGELQKLRVLCPDMYAPLVNEMARTNQEDSARLDELLRDHDFEKIVALAHKIKGGAQMADARGLIDACAQLESVALQGNIASCEKQVKVLLSAMHSLEQFLLDGL